MKLGWRESGCKFAFSFLKTQICSLTDRFSQTAWANRSHANFKMIWYEDIVRDRLGVIGELSAFTGFELPQEKLEELGDMLREGSIE